LQTKLSLFSVLLIFSPGAKPYTAVAELLVIAGTQQILLHQRCCWWQANLMKDSWHQLELKPVSDTSLAASPLSDSADGVNPSATVISSAFIMQYRRTDSTSVYTFSVSLCYFTFSS